MKSLRKTVGVTSLGRIRDDDIRNRIVIESYTEYINSYPIQWFGHLMRMEHNEISTSAYN